MFERFTDQARKVIVLAQENSRREGHLSIDVGHIGLAALTAGEGAGLDDDLVQRLQQALRSTLADQAIDHKHIGHTPFTTATKTMFERTLHRSLQDRRNYIDSRDLLLAALTDPDVATAVNSAGVNLDEIHSVVTTHAAGSDDTLVGDVYGHAPVLMPDPNQKIADLLAQILQRLDTIIGHLQPDRKRRG